jgi:4-amino-4-deoxy-L-arabinose transferase-like glycosyltransferase
MMKNVLMKIKKSPFSAILLIAIIARVVYFLFYFFSPEWNQLLVDSLFHDRWATSISGGNIVGTEPYFRAPLYIYILGAIYALFGHSLEAARIFGHLVGLVSVFLTYRLAGRLLSRKAAIIAGLFHALYPIAIYFESELLVESLFTMLIELSILSLFLAADRKSIKWYLATGLIFGLAVITRPVIFPLFILYLAWLWYKKVSAKSAGFAMLFTILGVIMAVAPVTIRNFIVSSETVLVASSGGINFFIGNNADADGLSATLPPPLGANWQIRDIRYLAEKETGRKLSDGELSDYWSGKGWDWIKSNKIDFLKLYIKKLYFCLNNYEISNNRNLPLFFAGNPITNYIPLNFALLLALALIFILSAVFKKQCGDENIFLFIFVIAYFLLISFFFINARFRMPMVPFFMIWAGGGIMTLISLRFKKGRRLQNARLIIFGAVIFIFSFSNLYRIRHGDTSSGLYNQANYYLYNNDYNRAGDIYRQLLKDYPYYPEGNLNLGVTFLKQGNIDSAKYYFGRELELNPLQSKALINLASVNYLIKAYDSAQLLADRAIALKPYFSDGYLMAIRANFARGDSAGIEKLLGEVQFNHVTDLRIFLEAGLIYSQWNNFDKAEFYLNKILISAPSPIEVDDDAFGYDTPSATNLKIKARAAYQLGYLFGLQKKLEKSIDMSGRAIALDSNLTEAYINLANGHLLQGQRLAARSIIAEAYRRFPQNEVIRALYNQSK